MHSSAAVGTVRVRGYRFADSACGCSQGCGVDAYGLARAGYRVPLVGETDLLGDALGRAVLRMDDRDEPLHVEHVAGVVTTSSRGFSGVPEALERRTDVIPDFDVGRSFDRLRR